MLKFDVLPYRHMGIGRQRRTQGTTGRKPLFFVASGFMPDDGVFFRGVGAYDGVAHRLRRYECTAGISRERYLEVLDRLG